MKRKGIFLLGLLAMLAIAGCATKTKEIVGNKTGISEGVKELSDHIRNAHGDELSADLVEQGYYFEVNQSATDGIFQVDFKAVTGDVYTPMLVFDVYVNDEELTARYEEIKLYAYFLNEYSYDNYPGTYPPWEGYGKQDAVHKNLYHVMVSSTLGYKIPGNSYVVDACQVDFVEKSGKVAEYSLDIPETRLTLPQSIFYPMVEFGYTDISFTHNGIEYKLNEVEYGQYFTRLRFICYADKDLLFTVPGETEQFNQNFRLFWKDFLANVSLETDGKTYSIEEADMMAFSEKEGLDEMYRGRGWAIMPGVNYLKAKEAILWVGTTGYDLKSTDKAPLTRELPTKPVSEMKPEQKELSDHLRSKCKDEISAGLVEQGYYYVVNDSRSYGNFRFDFKGLTGDEENRKMVFDVYVEDTMLAERYPMLRLDARCLREKNYDPQDNRIWDCTGYGIQDAENKQCYHVVMDALVFVDCPVVIDICRVGFGVNENTANREVFYTVSPEPYYLDVPSDVFALVLKGYYTDMTFAQGEKTYELNSISYENYKTYVEFNTLVDAAEVPKDRKGLWEYREEIQKDWLALSAKLTLVVDGTEYKVIDEEEKRGYVWFDVREGEDFYLGNAHPYFPPIDYGNASVIELKAGDTVYRLK